VGKTVANLFRKAEEEHRKQARQLVRDQVGGVLFTAPVPNSILNSQGVRNKFLEYNSTWVLENLPLLLTPRSVEKHRQVLDEHYAAIFEAAKADPNEISSDSESDSEEKHRVVKPVHLSLQAVSIARFWLTRARRLRQLQHFVAGIVLNRRQPACRECGSTALLQVEQLIPFHSIVLRFEKARIRGFPDMDADFLRLQLADQWRYFFSVHQRFQTRCTECIERSRAANERLGGGVSDDDESEFDAPAVEVRDTASLWVPATREVAALWLTVARRRLAGVPSMASETPASSAASSPRSGASGSASASGDEENSDNPTEEEEKHAEIRLTAAQRDFLQRWVALAQAPSQRP
jgi:hypothetical protein